MGLLSRPSMVMETIWEECLFPRGFGISPLSTFNQKFSVEFISWDYVDSEKNKTTHLLPYSSSFEFR